MLYCVRVRISFTAVFRITLTLRGGGITVKPEKFPRTDVCAPCPHIYIPLLRRMYILVYMYVFIYMCQVYLGRTPPCLSRIIIMYYLIIMIIIKKTYYYLYYIYIHVFRTRIVIYIICTPAAFVHYILCTHAYVGICTFPLIRCVDRVQSWGSRARPDGYSEMLMACFIFQFFIVISKAR